MTISDKMIKRFEQYTFTMNVNTGLDVGAKPHHVIPEDEVRSHLQQAVNAAWTRFDRDDESTWPISISIQYVNQNMSKMYWSEADAKYGEIDVWSGVTHYADPQDLIYVKNSEVKK